MNCSSSGILGPQYYARDPLDILYITAIIFEYFHSSHWAVIWFFSLVSQYHINYTQCSITDQSDNILRHITPLSGVTEYKWLPHQQDRQVLVSYFTSVMTTSGMMMYVMMASGMKRTEDVREDKIWDNNQWDDNNLTSEPGNIWYILCYPLCQSHRWDQPRHPSRLSWNLCLRIYWDPVGFKSPGENEARK